MVGYYVFDSHAQSMKRMVKMVTYERSLAFQRMELTDTFHSESKRHQPHNNDEPF